MISFSIDRTIRYWCLNNLKEIKSMGISKIEKVRTIEVNYNGKMIFLGKEDGFIIVV